MSSTREGILLALFAAISTVAGPKVLRGGVLPEKVPVGGVVIQRDGNPGDPEVTLSPLQYHYEHQAEAEIIVEGKTDAARAAAFDALIVEVGTALTIDRTLGGRCDWVEASAPSPVDLPVEGAQALKAAIITITLTYSTADPLG